jgi:hypothetical protein
VLIILVAPFCVLSFAVHVCEDTFVDIPDEDRCLQCNLMLPATTAPNNSSSSSSGTGMRVVASPSVHTGQLFMHPKTGTASAGGCCAGRLAMR